jgi:UDP-N-acetylglucosamine 4,6-dehydratase
LDQAIDLVLVALQVSEGGEIFVPKIPSMRVIDLAEALAPECDIKIMGIRPGEKLHECMISEEDGPYGVEHERFYVINPMIHPWYHDRKLLAGGKPLREGFRYSSDGNDQWLGKEQLRGILSRCTLSGMELIPSDEVDKDEPRSYATSVGDA